MAAIPDSDAKSGSPRKSGSIINEHGVSMMARMPEFHYLTRSEVESLTELGPQVFMRDEPLLKSGEENRFLVILLAGVCRIESPMEVGGQRVWVCVEYVHAPAILGEVSIFSTRPRSASVITDRKSVAIMVPHAALRDLFAKSRATLPRMLWTFARLGLARINASLARFTSLFEKYIRTPDIQPPRLDAQVRKLEMVTGPAAEESMVEEETFDQISALLENVDEALGLVSYLDRLEDVQIPSQRDVPREALSSLSPLAAAALERSGPLRAKAAVASALSENPGLVSSELGWAAALEDFIRAVEELCALDALSYKANDRRLFAPGTEKMVEGFAQRIERELDGLMAEVEERFGPGILSSPPEDENAAGRLESYLARRINEIKARVAVEDFETGSLLDDWRQSGEEIRNRVAMEIFNRLNRHPVMAAITANSCREGAGCSGRNFDGRVTFLDFFCMGCRLAYPTAGEGSFQIPPPYPV